MTREFEDRHVVVTGGTGALGAGVVARLLEAGARCHVPVYDRDELDGFAAAGHDRLTLVEDVDLTREREVESFYAALPSLWASIHCAGGFGMTPIAETGLEDYDRQMTRNATTAFLCCREAVRAIRRGDGGGGRLVNVAARPALEARQGAGMVAYAMSKAAVAALTVALGEELAEEGIWVNAIAPSVIDTPANRETMPDADHETWPGVDEIAETAVFLASPRNCATRGSVVTVYGRC